MPMRKIKLSFVTVAMNRVEHIKKTLPQNIADNQCVGIEFILLDYNSSDGLSEWVKENLSEHLKSGKLKLYRTDQPKAFNRSHSRNMAFCLANGEIVCGVDADNYTGKDFDKYILLQFSENKDILLKVETTREAKKRDTFGRFACINANFHVVGGYDETMKSYGSEDIDLYQRLEMAGCSVELMTDVKFLKTIQHSDKSRIENEYFSKNLKSAFIRHIAQTSSNLYLIMKDGSFKMIDICPNRSFTLPFSISHVYENSSENAFTSEWLKIHGFLMITDKTILKTLCMVVPMALNENKLAENKAKGIVSPNKSYGQGYAKLIK